MPLQQDPDLDPPIFTALSSSARSVFLEKALFTTYAFNASSAATPSPMFQVNLPALLETLQIFSLSDNPSASRNPYATASNDPFMSHRLSRYASSNNPFSNRVLGVSGLCRLEYKMEGSPLCIKLEESGVSTNCELNTYVVDDEGDNADIAIPFDTTAIALKVVMRASHLYDAVTELTTTSSASIRIAARPAPLGEDAAGLSLSASGPLGSATVDFSPTSSEPQTLETFACPRAVSVSYSSNAVKAASRAMAVASKVSVRVDAQGVLNLQFLIEVGLESGAIGGNGDGSGGVAFVDFRVIPLVEEGTKGGHGDGGSIDPESD
ncbi:checkpoint clamp complex protein Rad1 [Elasticomyces elasticus]|nr:checkpoint clamp complex protein Rad1 [Elasticomyces elasticus]